MTMRMGAAARPVPSLVVSGLLVILAALALWFAGRKIALYANFDPVSYDDLWPRRFGFWPHMVGGTVAIFTGVVQLWLGATGRTGALHRLLGRFYVGGVAVGAVGGFYLAATVSGGFAYSAGLTLLALAWVVTTGMALYAIRHRAIEQHREWMIRSYIVTFAFVTFRLIEHQLVAWNVAPPAELGTFMAYASWAVPLLLAEPFIQMRKIR